MYYTYVSLNLKCIFIFNCRKSTTCTHVLGLFHTLVSLVPAQFQATPSTTDDIELPLPITLYTCKWKVPRKRKESNMKMSDGLLKNICIVTNEKKNFDLLEGFNPHPSDCKG